MTDKLRETERDAFERALASKPDARFWNTTDAMFWAWQARAALAQQDTQAVPNVDLVARGIPWKECEALMEEACVAAGVEWTDDRRPQSIALNVMQRLANSAHKAGFKLGLERMALALNAAPAPPAQQDHRRSGCTAGTDEECVRRDCGAKCPALAQQDAQAVGQECAGCNGIGVVGNILDTVPCPFCNGSGNAAHTPPAQRVMLTEAQKTKAELWDLAVGKGLITIHSEQLAPGTWSAHLSVASWMEGHDKACDISNQAYDKVMQEKQS